MNKKAILDLIVDTLQRDLCALQEAVQLAHDSATHAESKAENKYDTRGLEASYLAHGQAQRAEQIATALAHYKSLVGSVHDCEQGVALDSLVQLMDDAGAVRWVWLGAEAGGLTLSYDGHLVRVVTPQAPLGKAMLGKQPGDEVALDIQGVLHEYEIVRLYY